MWYPRCSPLLYCFRCRVQLALLALLALPPLRAVCAAFAAAFAAVFATHALRPRYFKLCFCKECIC